MSHAIIRAASMGKKYKFGARRATSNRLGETMVNALKSPFLSLMRGRPKNKDQEFWALREVSFEIKEGEIVGVIGRNGAGKSTLLKILARITDPSEGLAEMFGRSAAILEVGLGFHGELTGRENIFLNGAILGMKRREIDAKFDHIVEFAELGQFLDMPIKHYSSGMYVRLAFSVAAFLEQEILIVDEVLAVGDMEFQKRCMGKMNEVARSGRTILFVSHDMTSVRQLCQRVLVLAHGKVVTDTSTDTAIDTYVSACSNSQEGERQWGDPPDEATLWPSSLQLLDEAEQLKTNFSPEQSITLGLNLDVYKATTCQITFSVINSRQICIFSTQATPLPTPYSPGRYRMRVTLPGSLLSPDLYHVALCIHNGFGEVFFAEDQAMTPVIEDTSRTVKKQWGLRPGVIYVNLPWEIEGPCQ